MTQAFYTMAVSSIWVFLILLAQNTGLRAQECGQAPLNTRIVGGENATAGVWPWQVSMHYRGAHICGGTVINTQWVLTAAHCIVSTTLSDYRLYFGKQTQNGSNPHEVNRTVSQIIVHPDYNTTTFNNDITLMKLSSPITYSDYIRPVCLAANSSVFHNGTTCWGTGWGRLSKDEPLVAYDILQEVQIPVIGHNECSCYYHYIGEANMTSSMLCAGELGKGICQGDSGGPVQCKQGSKWIQAGVASFGIPCAIGIPEVFARVSEFQPWITGQVAGTNVSFVEFTSTGSDPDSSFVCPVFNSSTPTTATPTTATPTTAAPNRAPSSELSFTAFISVILMLTIFP